MAVNYKLASQDPYYLDTIQTFVDYEDQLNLMWQLRLLNDCWSQGIVAQRLHDLIVEGRYLEDIPARRSFYQDLLPVIEENSGKSLRHCCWCYNKDFLLDREQGLGLSLHSKQGIQRNYDQGTLLLEAPSKCLISFESQPHFADDTITNKQLISEEQLQQLLALEKKYGRLLAKTCKKKDVLNILNLERLGLLAKDFKPSFEQDQEWTSYIIERQRQEALGGEDDLR